MAAHWKAMAARAAARSGATGRGAAPAQGHARRPRQGLEGSCPAMQDPKRSRYSATSYTSPQSTGKRSWTRKLAGQSAHDPLSSLQRVQLLCQKHGCLDGRRPASRPTTALPQKARVCRCPSGGGAEWRPAEGGRIRRSRNAQIRRFRRKSSSRAKRVSADGTDGRTINFWPLGVGRSCRWVLTFSILGRRTARISAPGQNIMSAAITPPPPSHTCDASLYQKLSGIYVRAHSAGGQF